MRISTNNSEVRKRNRNRVFRFINNTKETCMSEISAALEVSGPTVMSIVKELKEDGVIREVGEYESTGGRKAKAIASVKDGVYAIGVDITLNHVSLVYTDLGEEALKHRRVQKPFRQGTAYIEEVAGLVKDFVKENQIPEEKILGMGLSMPVIVDRSRDMIANSHVLGLYEVECEEWTSRMPYPCEIINDANAAALAEALWQKERGSMVYLLLSNSVGGAICVKLPEPEDMQEDIRERAVIDTYEGDNWRSAEFGHMTLHPGGKTCYCGKQGCVDAYCSASNLADLENGKLERFFEKLEAGNVRYQEIWQRYLGSFMEPYMEELKERLVPKDIFDHDSSYARPCRYQKEASALGAALYQIKDYIASI